MRLNSPRMTVIYNACMKASKSLIRDFGEIEKLQVSAKGPGDFVTAADKRTEKIIIEELLKAHPNYGILSEEIGEINKENKDQRWIIDPIDGTLNFLNGIPHFAISIGYEEKGEIVCGLIFDPIKDETFFAEKGSGAFFNNSSIIIFSVLLSAAVTKSPGPLVETWSFSISPKSLINDLEAFTQAL